MKTLTALASLLSLLSPLAASAQSVVFVVDAGDARLDVSALRDRVAAETELELVALGDDASRDAAETLTVANAGRGRWVLRHQRGTTDTWLERADVAPAAVAEVLFEATTALLRATRVHASPIDELYGTRAGADLMEPFDRRWDPLRTAIEGELVRPFIARGGMVYVGVADPFARDAGAVHLLNPWP